MSKFTSLIRRRRAQILLHSCLYYGLDSPIVSDDTWQRWADELAFMPFEKIDFFDEEFEDFTGATGMHLPFYDFIDKAILLSKYHIDYELLYA